MFGKAAKGDSGGTLRAPSLIGPGLQIQGGVSGPGDLHLDGRIVGDVSVHALTIGETGVVEGSVEAETVDVRGRLVGAIRAKTVRFSATAHVEADVTHEQMAVELGAHFQGRLTQTGTAPVGPPAQLAAPTST